MARPDTIIIDGRAYSWRALVEARKAQLEVWRKAQGVQPALFPLKEDCRPKAERTAAARHQEPTLMVWLESQTQNKRARRDPLADGV